MTEHDPVVEVANVSLKGLAFSGAVHISLVEDKVTAKGAILKNKATARIFREITSALLEQCWRSGACDNVTCEEELIFRPQHGAFGIDRVIAEEVTVGSDAADPLADSNAFVHILFWRARNIL